MFRVTPPALGGSFATKPDTEIVEERRDEQAAVVAAAEQVLSRGRSVHMALGSDGRWHLRRRAKQVRRQFGRGFSWMAARREDRDAPTVRRWAFPWWWI